MKEEDYALIRKRQKEIHGGDSPLVGNTGSTPAAKLASLYRAAQGMPAVPFDMLPEHTKEVWQKVAAGMQSPSVPSHVSVQQAPLTNNIPSDAMEALRMAARWYVKEYGNPWVQMIINNGRGNAVEVAKAIKKHFPFTDEKNP